MAACSEKQTTIEPASRKLGGKKRKAASDNQLPEAEKLRRERQRQLRVLALQAQAQGVPWKKAKTRLHHEQDGTPSIRPKQEKSPRKPRASLQVVVVPIYWKIKAHEANAVVAAAEKLKAQLADAGLQVYLDNDNHKTPGQKMHHWESKGVKVRVEIGPQDVGKGRCVVAVARKPGQVAIKTTVSNEEFVEKVKAVLGQSANAGSGEAAEAMGGDEEGEAEASRGSREASGSGRDQEQQAQTSGEKRRKGKVQKKGLEEQGVGGGTGGKGQGKVAGKGKLDCSVEAKEAENVGGEGGGVLAWQEEIAHTTGVQRAGHSVPVSGDALEDDFDIEVEAEEDKVLGTKGRREKFKKMRKDKKKSQAAGGQWHAEAGNGPGDGRDCAVKVVKF